MYQSRSLVKVKYCGQECFVDLDFKAVYQGSVVMHL